MLKVSDQSWALARPNASSCSVLMPRLPFAYSPRYCSMSSGANRSKPAATAVWVVKRLPARVAASAAAKSSPDSRI